MPDSKRLHCWLYCLDTARLKNITLQEVIDMTPQLKDFIEQDAGFRQFGDRYSFALGDPEVRKEYAMWVNELMREQGRIESAELRERSKWQTVVADKDKALADKDAEIARLRAQLEDSKQLS